MNCLNKVTARTSLLRVLEHIVYPSNNNNNNYGNKNDNKEWQKHKRQASSIFFFCLSLFMGADIETLLGNCLNLSNPLDNQQNQRKVDRATKKNKDSTIWHSFSACRGLGALRLYIRSDQPDQRISRLSGPKTSPVKYLNTSTTTIVEQQTTTTASAKNNGNINNIKDNKAALSNVLSSIGLRSLTNFNCQSFVQSQ